MPSPEDSPLAGPEDARAVVAEACFSSPPDAPALGRVGVECEFFPIRVGHDRWPAGRLGMDEVRALLAGVDPPFGRFSIEPGAQVEHATAVHPTASGALRELEQTSVGLARAFGAAGAVLASVGLDPWHASASVRQQLSAPRYPAMAAYFAQRGPHGHAMMCHTCSLQINLDLGEGDAAAERWLVANLAAPIVVATFACSPVSGAVSGRALAWSALDPTRTGVPTLLVEGVDDPVAQMAAFAMAADVMLVRRPDSGAIPGCPGWRFADWLADGHPAWGRPTAGDLAYHLTTLFPEVRPRGFLELRGVDAVPARWRGVPVTLLTGLLADPGARSAVREMLERYRAHLPALLRRGATVGVADPRLCALAVETWSLALAGARRLPTGYIRAVDFRRAEAFLDHFTLRGRCPADELRERLALSRALALAWATEPAEELSWR